MRRGINRVFATASMSCVVLSRSVDSVPSHDRQGVGARYSEVAQRNCSSWLARLLLRLGTRHMVPGTADTDVALSEMSGRWPDLRFT
jgi:hypothetical protein